MVLGVEAIRDKAYFEETCEKIIRTTYRKARASGDKNVYFIAGKTYFKKDRENCMVDGCHPNDLGFWCMANAYGAVVEKLLKK